MSSRSWKNIGYFLGKDRPYVFDLSSFEEGADFYQNNRDFLEDDKIQEKTYFPYSFRNELPNSANILVPEILTEEQHSYYRGLHSHYSHVFPIREMGPESSDLIFMAFALTFGSRENKSSFITRDKSVFRGIKKINSDDLSKPVDVFYKNNNDRFDFFRD